MHEVIYASATALARAIRAQKISSAEVVQAYLQRIAAVNHTLNAVVQLRAEAAQAEARAADVALASGHIIGPLHGVPMTIKDSLDTAGVITTGGTIGRATCVPAQDVTVRGLRVALYTDNGVMAVTPDTAAAVHRAATALTEAGAVVHEDRPAMLERAEALYNNLSDADGRAWVRRLLQRAGTTAIHPQLQKRLEDARPLSVGDFTALLEEVDRLRSAMLTFLHHYDLILCPVCAFPASPHGTTMSIPSYTGVYNMTGWPGAVVRGSTSPEGLPIGVQSVARPWREDVALAVAQYLEEALGGWQRPPL